MELKTYFDNLMNQDGGSKRSVIKNAASAKKRSQTILRQLGFGGQSGSGCGYTHPDEQEGGRRKRGYTKKRSAIKKRSAAIKKRSAAIKKRSAAIKKRSAAIKKRSAKKRSAIKKRSAAIKKRSAAIKKRSAAIKKRSSAIKKRSSAIKKKTVRRSGRIKGRRTTGSI
jgi:hypothetical protein